jgi:hypothetical protein
MSKGGGLYFKSPSTGSVEHGRLPHWLRTSATQLTGLQPCYLFQRGYFVYSPWSGCEFEQLSRIYMCVFLFICVFIDGIFICSTMFTSNWQFVQPAVIFKIK